MEPDHTQFTTIPGISEIRRLTRIGKIHLGVRKPSTKSASEYPENRDCFIFEKNHVGELCRHYYGETPRELLVLLPSDDITKVFPQAYKKYGKRGLHCKGNGREAVQIDEQGKSKLIDCTGRGDADAGLEPCAEFAAGHCKMTGNLMIILPLVDITGVFQIDTGSRNNLIDINSGFDQAVEFARKHGVPITQVPCKLRRVARQSQVEGKRKINFMMVLTIASIDEARSLKSRLGPQPLPSDERYELPPHEQARFEEKDLIPERLWEGQEPEEAELVHEPGTSAGEPVPPAPVVPTGPLEDPPPGVREADAWERVIAYSRKYGIKTWEELMPLISGVFALPISQVDLVGLNRDQLRQVCQQIRAEGGK